MIGMAPRKSQGRGGCSEGDELRRHVAREALTGRRARAAFLGVELDSERNLTAHPDFEISAEEAPVRTLVITAREDLQIAREVRQVLGPKSGEWVGRFLPAYGIRFADHTSFTRAPLGLDTNDQVYALELSYTGDRHLLQVSVGEHADAGRAFTTTGRWQFDLSPRTVLVASGLFRDASSLGPRGGSAGLAIGIAPSSRLTVWAQADARFRDATTSGKRAYTLLSDAAFEVYRGVWLKLSPQLRTEFGDTSAGIVRLVVGVNLLPRTHWNVVLNWYHDRDRKTDGSARTLLAQLHLYL